MYDYDDDAEFYARCRWYTLTCKACKGKFDSINKAHSFCNTCTDRIERGEDMEM